MNLFSLHMVQVDPATAANAVDIDQIESIGYEAGTQRLIRAATVDTKFAAILAQAHRFSIVNSALATLLAEASGKYLTNALPIDSGGETPGAVMWYKKRADLGTFASGAAHIKCTVASGMILPRGLNVAVNSLATMSQDLVAIYDGTNEPVVTATGQAIAGTPGADEYFTLGPVYIDTTEVEDAQGFAITAGLAERLRFGSKYPTWPTYLGIAARQPSVTVNLLDVTWLNTLGLAGSGHEITLFLRKLENKAKTYADNTANHIKLVINEAHVSVDTISAQFSGEAEPGLVITPVQDSSDNDIIAVTIDTAIVAPT